MVDVMFTNTPIRKNKMLIYCDYIAELVKTGLLKNDSLRLLEKVSGVMFDLDENGIFKSTTKTIEVVDKYKTKYKITVEEIPEVKSVVIESPKEIIKSPKRSKKDGADKPV